MSSPRPTRSSPFAALAIALAATGFVLSLRAFYPGWMSNDSAVSYYEATHDRYVHWQPVLLAWWWRALDHIVRGPALFLIQNVAMYWGGLLVFSLAGRRLFGGWALAFVLIGFSPGLLFPLGQIWKDVVFAVVMVLGLGLMFRADLLARAPAWWERALFLLLLTFAFGVKTNGLTALPFVAGYWAHLERRSWPIWAKLLGGVGISALCVALAQVPVPSRKIVRSHVFQYTETHDLLGIFVRTGTNLLPGYVQRKLAPLSRPLRDYYYPGSNNLLFYNSGAGNLSTRDPVDLKELDARWRQGVREHPVAYLQHRAALSAQLLRIGEAEPAWVAVPMIVKPLDGIDFHPNRLSNALVATTTSSLKWVYFPWVYGVLLLLAAGAWKWLEPAARPLMAALQTSAWAFVLPHFFVGPASDYRYLYFAYFCAAIAALLSAGSLVSGVRVAPRRR